MGFDPLMLFQKKKMSPSQELKCFEEVKNQLIELKIHDLKLKRDKLEKEIQELKVEQKDSDCLYVRKNSELQKIIGQKIQITFVQKKSR